MVRLTGTLAQTIRQESGIAANDTCVLRFTRDESLGFLEHSFVEALRNVPVYVRETAAESAGLRVCEVQPVRADVTYERVFREGWFTERKVIRSVVVEISFKILRTPGGDVVASGLRSERFRDTIRVRDIERIETPIVKATHAELPSGSLFERLVEPLVILVSAGVVIYLFYTVRS